MSKLAAGTPITCENGHVICKTQMELRRGQLFDPSDLAEWTYRRPLTGEKLDTAGVCPECHAQWIKGSHIWQIHTAQGWWPE